MARIKEVLKIQSSYSAQVDLKREFADINLKEERMANYKPIKAHRKAFEIIASGAYDKNSKRSFILSGSYGTGKSHLLLMTANYFESPSDTREMTEFFNNYAESEENEQEKHAEKLKKVRKENRYLVCICDYGSNSFETYILRAVKEALIREGISDTELDSYYLQAIKKIRDWEASDDSYFYDRLASLLESKHTNWTINKLIQELNAYNKDAINIFKEIYKVITTSNFEYDKDSYVSIIDQLSKSKVIKDNFVGLLILFDEFDYQVKGSRFKLEEFQKFSQLCAMSFMQNFPIIFVATTHRSFASYKTVYNEADFMTVNDRIKEIPLETQGIEEIISAVVNPQKQSELWEKEIKPQSATFNTLSNECSALKIFDWLPAPKVRLRIVENIYPMHPMATYSLLKLASDVGSNNRSVYTFFADEKNDIGSYDWFARNNEILSGTGELQLYTIDLLFEYFKDKLNSDNQELRQTVKETVRNFETSMRELKKSRSTAQNLLIHDAIFDRLLKTMVIYQIIGVQINVRSLKFGLNMSTTYKEKELEHVLNVARSNKIIYLNDTNQCFEFRRNDAIDINGLIRDFKDSESNMPEDLIAEIDIILKQEDIKKVSKFFRDEYYLEPEKYNQQYREDKRILRRFCLVKDLEGHGFFAGLIAELDNETEFKKSYEGIALYVICETEDEVRRAKILAANNSSNKIMVGIPLEENKIFDDVFSLKAAFALDRSDFSQQDLGVLKELIQHYDNSLYLKLKSYITSRNLIYFGEKGSELSHKHIEDDYAAVRMLENIYEVKRNKIRHDDLNKNHDFKESKNASLKEAVEILLDYSKPLSFRKDYGADRGDKKYIHNVLLQYGVIKQIQTISNDVYCDLESDLSKFEKVLPALAAMIREIPEYNFLIKPDGFIEDYMKQFGIGYNAAILYFAIVKRFYKDSLTIMPEAHDIGTLKVTSYDSLLDLLYNKKHKNAVMEYKSINEHDLALIDELNRVFTADSEVVTGSATLERLFEQIKNWYKNLPQINRVKGVYKNNEMDRFIEVLTRINQVNARDFVLEEIKTVYGYDKSDLVHKNDVPSLIEKIKKDKDRIEQGYDIVRDFLMDQIKIIFEADNSSLESISLAISEWYSGLNEFQKSCFNDLQNEDSKPLVLLLGKGGDFEELFMCDLPKSYNLSIVKTWMTNKCDSYIQKIKDGKHHIENGLNQVQAPSYKLIGDVISEYKVNPNHLRVKYKGVASLEISSEEMHKKIYITSNGDDPRNDRAQRYESNSTYLYETKEDKQIKFCGMDGEGKYSSVTLLELANDENKYEVKYVAEQLGMNEIDSMEDFEIHVILPKDVESLKKCLKSILKQSKERYSLEDSKSIGVLKSLISEYED